MPPTSWVWVELKVRLRKVLSSFFLSAFYKSKRMRKDADANVDVDAEAKAKEAAELLHAY